MDKLDQIIELSNLIKREERETGKVPNTIPPASMHEKLCAQCNGNGVVKVNECTCGGVDIGVGTMHYPDCGEEQCPSCGGSGVDDG